MDSVDTFEIVMLVLCIAMVAYHFWRDATHRKRPAKKLAGRAWVMDRASLLVVGFAGACVFSVLMLWLWGYAWEGI